jgi:hypothetical protein
MKFDGFTRFDTGSVYYIEARLLWLFHMFKIILLALLPRSS